MTDNSDQSDAMAGWRGTLHQWWRTKGLIMMMMMMVMMMIMVSHLCPEMVLTTLIERNQIISFCHVAPDHHHDHLSDYHEHLISYPRHHNPNEDLMKATLSCPKVSPNSDIVDFPAYVMMTSALLSLSIS